MFKSINNVSCNHKINDIIVFLQLYSHVTGSYQPGTWVGGTDYSNKFITEMEMKGKQFCDSDETDKPPFNFQVTKKLNNANTEQSRTYKIMHHNRSSTVIA